jgi:riboflavin kinase / FMN adenylyltransferase
LTINITGKVIHGDHYGKVLGFPTANLDRRDYVRQGLKVRLGIYAGTVIIGITSSAPRMHSGHLLLPPSSASGGLWRASKEKRGLIAAIVIGPIDRNGLPKIEAHLIGFKGNLYGKKITLELHKYIRPFKKFKNEEELKKEIKKDIKIVKQLKY